MKSAFEQLCGDLKQAHIEVMKHGITDPELLEIGAGVLETCFELGAKWALSGCPKEIVFKQIEKVCSVCGTRPATTICYYAGSAAYCGKPLCQQCRCEH